MQNLKTTLREIKTVYLLLSSLIVTWLHFRSLNILESVPGNIGDHTEGIIFQSWLFQKEIFERNIEFFAYPIGLEIKDLIDPLRLSILIPMFMMTTLVGPVLAFNSLIIIGITFTCFVPSYFLYKKTQQFSLSLLAVVFIGNLSFFYEKAQGHIVYTQLFWVLLVIFLLKIYLDNPRDLNKKKGLVLSTGISVSTLLDGYIFISISIILLTFLIIHFLFTLRDKRLRINQSNIISYISLGLLPFFIIFPISKLFNQNLLEYQTRSLDDLVIYSARFWMYLLPGENNFLFHDLGYLKRTLVEFQGTNTSESSLYIGTFILFFATGTTFYAIKKYKMNFVLFNISTWFLMVLMCIFFLVSLQPFFTIAGTNLPNLSYLTYSFIPQARSLNRLGIFSIVIFIYLVLQLFHMISATLSHKKLSIFLIAAMVSSLFDSELFNKSDIPKFDFSRQNQIFYKLQKESSNRPIIFYPILQGESADQLPINSYSLIHSRPIINAGGNITNFISNNVKDLNNRQTAGILNFLNVDAILVEKNFSKTIKIDPIYYQRVDLPPSKKGLDNFYFYRLLNHEKASGILGASEFSLEYDSKNQVSFFWSTELNTKIPIYCLTNSSKLRLEFYAKSFYYPQTLTIYKNEFHKDVLNLTQDWQKFVIEVECNNDYSFDAILKNSPFTMGISSDKRVLSYAIGNYLLSLPKD